MGLFDAGNVVVEVGGGIRPGPSELLVTAECVRRDLGLNSRSLTSQR